MRSDFLVWFVLLVLMPRRDACRGRRTGDRRKGREDLGSGMEDPSVVGSPVKALGS